MLGGPSAPPPSCLQWVFTYHGAAFSEPLFLLDGALLLTREEGKGR